MDVLEEFDKRFPVFGTSEIDSTYLPEWVFRSEEDRLTIRDFIEGKLKER